MHHELVFAYGHWQSVYSVKVVGGHLNEARVSATCEMVVTAIPGTLEREYREDVGLNLFRF